MLGRRVGIAVVFVVAALSVVPMMTQAAKPKPPRQPIWIGCKPEPTVERKCQTISWGTLTFNNAQFGSITCKKSDAGNIWNEINKARELQGKDEIVLMDFYECEGKPCKGVEVKALNLPWQTELVRVGTSVYDVINGITLEFGCKESGIKGTATGTETVKMVNGKPLTEEFTGESGSLTSPAGPVTITGKDKNMGFVNQERIKVK